ncbi:MAG: 50S ribosomal protein L20 [Patescibacteria group bacterium]
MPRVKRGVLRIKKRKALRQKAKGFRGRNKNLIRMARPTVTKAGKQAFAGRRVRKQEMRQLWQIRINAAARLHGLTYSKLMAGLKKNKIDIDRKILAQLANEQPKIFTAIIEAAKK